MGILSAALKISKYWKGSPHADGNQPSRQVRFL